MLEKRRVDSYLFGRRRKFGWEESRGSSKWLWLQFMHLLSVSSFVLYEVSFSSIFSRFRRECSIWGVGSSSRSCFRTSLSHCNLTRRRRLLLCLLHGLSRYFLVRGLGYGSETATLDIVLSEGKRVGAIGLVEKCMAIFEDIGWIGGSVLLTQTTSFFALVASCLIHEFLIF